jgi:uncharacterized protein YndB with AHSA1/START domain
LPAARKRGAALGQTGPMSTVVSVSRAIDAPAEQVWALISDLPRMGDWSPENTGGAWVKGATGPALGARFKGTNGTGKRRWSTQAEVTACEPGRAFGFRVRAGGMAVADWTYRIEPTDSGCTVTETWTDTRGWLIKTVGGVISGVKDRESFNRAGMETTLANLAASVHPGT